MDTTLLKIFTAFLCGIPETICIMPFEIAKIQLQLDYKYGAFDNNMIKALKVFGEKYGWKAAFSTGFIPMFYRQASWSAGYFASVLHIQRLFVALFSSMSLDPSRFISPILMCSGFIAGVFATAVNTPGDTVRTVMQVRTFLGEGRTLSSPSLTTLSVAKDIFSRRGFQGLYAGFKVKSVYLGVGGAMMAVLVPIFDSIW